MDSWILTFEAVVEKIDLDYVLQTIFPAISELPSSK
jgi:hypothetical protein